MKIRSIAMLLAAMGAAALADRDPNQQPCTTSGSDTEVHYTWERSDRQLSATPFNYTPQYSYWRRDNGSFHGGSGRHR